MLSATNRVTHHVWVDTKTHLHTMINTQTRSDETSGESSPGDGTEHVNLLGPSQQDTLQKTPYTVKILLKWKSFLLCMSVRRNDLMTAVISWRLSNFSVICCQQTVKKLITTFPTAVKLEWVQSLSCRLTQLWPGATMAADYLTSFHEPEQGSLCLGEWKSHAASCLHHYI